MTLSAGTKLGPYEILGSIGAGGMGEVYRARDPRLGREVAVKVLPASFSDDADRLRRFEQEARAAGVLNHPNITAVYDIGSQEGSPYVVQELLEGETLRAILAGGRLSPRKAVEYSLQIAHGLAAAHEKGIVHRDLKPENLFVTRDGRVKILDFGLAKLTQTEGASGTVTNLPTETRGTEPGVVMGTLGYMSPEQVRGKPADARSDIFSFGAILYEMLSGKRAFHGDSAADTMSAILREDPPDLSVTNQAISPGLDRIVRHCLEKNPEQRFHSAHDLAFDIEALSGTSGIPAAAAIRPTARAGGRAKLLASAVAALAVALLAFWAGRRSSPAPQAQVTTPVHQRLTFRRGNVLFARLTPDGQNVVYGAAWGDQPAEIYLTRIGSPETRPLGIADASLLSVSPSGELAILQKRSNLFGVVGAGTLARVPLAGGTPRQVLENVFNADWAPDGASLAVVREVEGKTVLEYPIGKRLYAGDIAIPRVSPDGKTVAFIEGTNLAVVDTAGNSRTLTKGFTYVDSLAWHPSGREVWFAAIRPDTGTAIFAVDLTGNVRTVTSTTDLEVMHDIARDGGVLVERELNTREILFSSSQSKAPRDLSWLDQSQLAAVSGDGKTILFDEVGEGGGPGGSVYLRGADGSPAARLGEGTAFDLSPDGKWALTLPGTTRDSSGSAIAPRPGPGTRLVLLPTGAGQPRTIPTGTLRPLDALFVPPDGKRVAVFAAEVGHGERAYLTDLEGGSPRAFTPEGLTNGAAFSPDGKLFAVVGADNRAWIYPVAGGEPRPIPGLQPGDVPVQWSSDGAEIFAVRFGEMPTPIYRLRLSTGKRELWKELLPADRAGLIRIENVRVTPDGKAWAYSYNRVTASDLFLVTGWK